VSLKREVGLFGATMIGLGSILGTGVFVSLGMAAGVAGPAVIASIGVAAAVALCNGLSSAQLAARHPVSGGTYEYGYRWLHPRLGFTAGWMFLCAKSASAATAALGFSGYLLTILGYGQTAYRMPLAVAAVALLTVLAWRGLRRSSHVNAVIVSVTILSLLVFVIAGVPGLLRSGFTPWVPLFSPPRAEMSPLGGFLEACALMFVAFTGYGRIATMAEEVRHPVRTIPVTILVTLTLAMALYMAVGIVSITAVGAARFAVASTEAAAPLEVVAREMGHPVVAFLVAGGAITAMLGVLLNLILGLSRAVLAMARRGDLPALFASIDASTGVPSAATGLVGLLIAGLICLGDVKTTWSFSAFSVLIYYAITNWAALRLSPQERFLPRPFAWLGLGACLILAFWVEFQVWTFGLLLIAIGLIWHEFACRRILS